MKGFLIDTNIVSEYNRAAGPDVGVRRWVERTPLDSQYLSVITIGEIEKGIDLLPEGKRRTVLQDWLRRDLEMWFADRILPVDRAVGHHWGKLVAAAIRRGKPLPTIDSLIAATALTHDLTVVTRNLRDFESTGVATFNPWE